MDPNPTYQVISDPRRTFQIIDPFTGPGPKEHYQVKNCNWAFWRKYDVQYSTSNT
jgi:hypothetical protein